MNTFERHHVNRVARIGCVICRQMLGEVSPAEIHHVAEGSGLRSWFAVAGLCHEHHRGGTGLHGMGTKRFCEAYSVPNGDEYGLLVWVNEYLAVMDLHGLEEAVTA